MGGEDHVKMNWNRKVILESVLRRRVGMISVAQGSKSGFGSQVVFQKAGAMGTIFLFKNHEAVLGTKVQ